MFYSNKLSLLLTLLSIANAHDQNTSTPSVFTSSHTHRSVAYYVNWAKYNKNYQPLDLPVESLTHVIYAFADISNNTGEVHLSKPWLGTELQMNSMPRVDSKPMNQTEAQCEGYFGQLFALKRANRRLKVLLSIGGANYSSNFPIPASTSSGRSTFVSTAISLVKNLGLDGLDINWEDIADDEQANHMVMLIKAVREGLDAYGESLGIPYRFALTVASPALTSHYRLSEMDKYVDFWNLMAYDYSGPWSHVSGNHANLFKSVHNPPSTPFDTETIVQRYRSHGISKSKIVLGIPLYGRSFENTTSLGSPFNGTDDISHSKIYSVQELPLAGAKISYDSDTASSFSYDPSSKQLISYDESAVVRQKADWVKRTGLGGLMWWESSDDRQGERSLIRQAAEILDGSEKNGLESLLNHVHYPDSPYVNIRNCTAPTIPLSYNQSSFQLGPTQRISTVTSTRFITTSCGLAFLQNSFSTNSTSPFLPAIFTSPTLLSYKPSTATTRTLPTFTTETSITTLSPIATTSTTITLDPVTIYPTITIEDGTLTADAALPSRVIEPILDFAKQLVCFPRGSCLK